MRRFLKKPATVLLGAAMAVAIASPATAAPSTGMESSNVSAQLSWCNGDTFRNVSGYGVRYPAYNTSVNCQMSIGSQNGGVRILQRALRYCNLREPIAVDGIFGSGTAAALERAQRKAGASPDGVYGPETRKRILWMTDSGHCRRLNY
ncbi:peptidoglycan-binding domain-containing protein [Salininema proteolyticum]|uniref:Peptidoglycan-binding protein n=1 Tax=Salininema proteolyticum TaxID=1607685 RepID=A0ABV8U4D6_9ACTN